VIYEEMDEVWIIQVHDDNPDGYCRDYSRLAFFRDGSLIATRLLSDEMLFVPVGDHFQIIWRDYWSADRLIECKKLSNYCVAVDPTNDDNAPWWGMQRRMRDLKAIPAP
jgi:hypothetical protein